MKRPDHLLSEIRELILAARSAAGRSVNTIQVLTNFEIGRRIVNHEQKGTERAEYGKQVLKALSVRLTEEFGRGFSRSNLEYMRKFFLTYRDRLPEKSQIASGKLQAAEKSQASSGKSGLFPPQIISQPQTKSLFALSWSQYVFLVSIESKEERKFYEIEATNNG